MNQEQQTKDLMIAPPPGGGGDERQLATTHGTEVKKEEAKSQIQAALLIAKRFPRDEERAEERIQKSCRRYSLAETAVYTFPRGGQKVFGPSIRLAEAMAQSWGNLRYGFSELERENGRSLVEAYAHDLETNTLVSRTFSVDHKVTLRTGQDKLLRDARDIYEHVASQAQRRVRAAILQILPGDVVEKAVRVCQQTLEMGDKAESPADRVKRMTLAFSKFGVSIGALEKRLGHGVDKSTPAELSGLTQIYNSLRDGVTNKAEWFDVVDQHQQQQQLAPEGKAKLLNQTIKQA